MATLFGTDPKHEMDDDLARMKLLIQQDAGRLREAGRPVEGLSPQEEHRQRGGWLPRS
ncbi:hypothetical protein D3C80_2072260 [compost metagenome]